jgi:hypothetical protein
VLDSTSQLPEGSLLHEPACCECKLASLPAVAGTSNGKGAPVACAGSQRWRTIDSSLPRFGNEYYVVAPAVDLANPAT